PQRKEFSKHTHTKRVLKSPFFFDYTAPYRIVVCYLVVFGSKASFKPSPTKLIDRIVNVIQTAGGTQIHNLFWRTSVCLASINIFPQLGISGGTPTPIKLNPASATI